MILRRIQLRDFGRFARFEAAFGPGLNLIRANNEEGKSTLQEAIGAALFQDPKTSDKKILGRRRWGAAEHFALELEFSEGGKTYVLTRDFQTRSLSLLDLETDETLRDARAVESRIKEMLGLGSRQVFDSTVRVSQREMTRIQAGQEIADSLQKLVTGGEQDVQASKVVAALDKALSDLKTSAKNNPGPLATLPPRLAERERLLEEKRLSFDRVGQAEKDLAAARARLEEMRQDLQGKEALARDCDRRFRVEDELSRAVQEEVALDEKLTRARTLQDGIEQMRRDLGPYEAVLGVPDTLMGEVAVLESQIDPLESAPSSSGVGSKGPTSREMPPVGSGPMTRPGRGRPFVIAGLAASLIGLAGGIFYPALFVLILVGLGFVAWGVLSSRSTEAESRALAERIRAEERRKTAEEARARLGQVLDRAGCATTSELRARRQEGERLARQIAVAVARLDGLLGGQAVEEIENRRKEASRAARSLREQLDEPAMRLAKLDQSEYQRLKAEIQRISRAIEEWCNEELSLRVEVRAGQVSLEEIYSLEEEAQELRGELGAARERQRVLVLARDVLEEARQATLVSATEVLRQQVGQLVDEITHGRYREVHVDPARLSIELVSPDKGGRVAVALDGELSTGTVEQVYLAARIAMARLLARGKRPPLILDDPFLTFDPARTEAVLGLCQRLSRDTQVLFFTCREGYEGFADNLVRLPGLKEAIPTPSPPRLA